MRTTATSLINSVVTNKSQTTTNGERINCFAAQPGILTCGEAESNLAVRNLVATGTTNATRIQTLNGMLWRDPRAVPEGYKESL